MIKVITLLLSFIVLSFSTIDIAINSHRSHQQVESKTYSFTFHGNLTQEKAQEITSYILNRKGIFTCDINILIKKATLTIDERFDNSKMNEFMESVEHQFLEGNN